MGASAAGAVTGAAGGALIWAPLIGSVKTCDRSTGDGAGASSGASIAIGRDDAGLETGASSGASIAKGSCEPSGIAGPEEPLIVVLHRLQRAGHRR